MTDFAQYLHRLQAAAAGIQASDRFVARFTANAPAHPDDLDDMIAEVGEAAGLPDLALPPAMKAFYTTVNGFHLAWQERRPDGDRVVAGLARLPIVNAIYEPEGQPAEALYEAPHLFDRVGEEDQVYVRLGPDGAEPRFTYLAGDTGRHHELPLGFAEYLELLLECRAMYPWQRLFVPDLDAGAAAREAFVQDLRRLFPDADAGRFAAR